MRKFICFSIGSIFLSWYLAAHADYTGVKLLHDCQIYVRDANDNNSSLTVKKLFAEDRCAIYMQGIIMGYLETLRRIYNTVLVSSINDNKLNNNVFCIPNDLTAEQGVRIIAKYLKNNPEELDKYPVVLIYNAFLKAFPCNQAGVKNEKPI